MTSRDPAEYARMRAAMAAGGRASWSNPDPIKRAERKARHSAAMADFWARYRAERDAARVRGGE